MQPKRAYDLYRPRTQQHELRPHALRLRRETCVGGFFATFSAVPMWVINIGLRGGNALGSPTNDKSAKRNVWARSQGDEMTKDQMRGECDRLRGLLEGYEARATATSIPDRHEGLRLRFAVCERKLEEMERA